MNRRALFAGLLALTLPVSARAADFRQVFPYPKAAVYQALVETLSAEGFKIKDQDAVILRVTASSGVSAFSVGENVSISVADGAAPGDSVLELVGSKKMQVGVLVGGRVQKQFDKIVLAVSRRLQGR